MCKEEAEKYNYPASCSVYEIVVNGERLRMACGSLNTMGNVNAAMRLNDMIRDSNPKAVIMIGLACGYYRDKNTFKQGDVGYGGHVVYTSYSTLREARSVEQRAAEGKQDPGFFEIEGRYSTPYQAEPYLITAAQHVSGQGSTMWRKEAQSFFKRYETKWEKDISVEQYPPQSKIPRGLKAHAVTIGSGESVIKSKRFQDMVVGYYKALKHAEMQPVRMFEMEAYGVAGICKSLQIPFLVVKGISDHGESENKLAHDSPQKKDSNRLSAICSATSFALQVIKDQAFLQYIKSYPLNEGYKENRCLHPGVPRCEYKVSYTEDGRPVQPCADWGFRYHDIWGREAPVTRVFEGVSPTIYSRILAEYFTSLLSYTDTDEKVTLFFHYSPADLLHYFRDLHVETLGGEANDLESELDKKWPTWRETNFNWGALGLEEKRRIAKKLVVIGRRASIDLRHFGLMDIKCNELINKGVGFEDLKKRVCRVIVCNYNDPKQVIENPLYILYPALLGICVPSLIIKEERLRNSSVVDDVCFIQAPFLSVPENKEEKIQILRFGIRSNTVILSGKECEESRKHNINHKLINDFTDQWENTELRKPIDRFPFVTLINKFVALFETPTDEDGLWANSLLAFKEDHDFFKKPPENGWDA